MAAPSYTYTLTNGNTADADQVQQNFSDILNGCTDGTKDLTINALTMNGAFVGNGHVTLGNGSIDDLTFSGSIASTLTPKTDGTYDLGTAVLGFRALYLGDGSGDTVKIAVPTLAADYVLTLPTTDGNAGDIPRSDGSGNLSFVPKQNYSIAGTVGSSALTIALKDAGGSDASSTSPIDIPFRSSTSATGTLITRSVTAALSTVISSGSTAGFASGKTEFLYVYALDNSGTVELAWSASRIWDENTVQTTTAEGGAGASDSKVTLYSTTARSNVPIRLLGRMKFSLTTAGTWDEVPDEASVAVNAPLSIKSEVRLDDFTSQAGDIVTFTTTTTNTGSAFTIGSSSTITINEDGLYCCTIRGRTTAAGDDVMLVKNNTVIVATNDAKLIAYFNINVNSRILSASNTVHLVAGDVLRTLITAASGTPSLLMMQITKIT